MTGGDLFEGGLFAVALLGGEGAAGGEAAAGLGIDGAGDLALDDVDLLGTHGQIGHGQGVQQGLGVGVDGVVAQRVHGGGFAGTILVFVKKDSSHSANEQFKCLFGEKNVFKLSVRPYGAMRVVGDKQ